MLPVMLQGGPGGGDQKKGGDMKKGDDMKKVSSAHNQCPSSPTKLIRWVAL